MSANLLDRLIVLIFLLLVSFAIFGHLGKRPLFGVEGRWAEGAREMSLRGSNFVPTLNFEPHVTKPLLPFWLIKKSGELLGYSEFSVRLPGAILAFVSVFIFFGLSLKIFEAPYAKLATFLYGSSLGFLQFVRLAQSEIYQLTGLIIALTVYVYFREKKSLIGYLLFFLGLLIATLSKGLTAVAVLTLFVMIDILFHKLYFHFNPKAFLALFLGVLLYFLPYYLTSHEMQTSLPFYLWFRENLKQAVDPYDNLRPFYIYLYFWPLWLAPFSLFLLSALYKKIKNFSLLTGVEKVFLLSNLAIFLLFTIAKARRGYYILPILPFSIMLITLYIKRFTPTILPKIYTWGAFVIPLITLSSPFILKSFGFTITYELIFYTILFFLLQVGLLLLRTKISYPFLAIVLLYLSIEALYFGLYQPYFSQSTEKEAGKFVKTLITEHKNLRLCAVSKEEGPVANFYFYAEIKEKVPLYREEERALKECHVLILRKTLPPQVQEKARALNFIIRSFENRKEPSKSYYILYNSSTLNTPSL